MAIISSISYHSGYLCCEPIPAPYTMVGTVRFDVGEANRYTTEIMNVTAKTPQELVHNFPFFAGLDEVVYQELLTRGRTRQFVKGEILFLEDSPSQGLYLIQSGAIKIFKLAASGREQIIAILRPGDSVAELPLFDDGPYPASAAAMEDAAVLFIPKDAFHQVLSAHPELGRSVIAALAKRMRKLVLLIEDLSLRQVRQRLARLLLEEAGEHRSFHLAYTNDELAARLGSVRDVISRTLSGMQADGLIRVHARKIDIVDRNRLCEES